MASEPSNSPNQTFRLFDEKPTSGFGFINFPEKPLPPPPPCLDTSFRVKVSSNVKYTVKFVNVDGLTLLKVNLDGSRTSWDLRLPKVHFQDFNAEVLQHLTIPNVNANIQKKSQYFVNERSSIEVDTHIFAGDWGEVHSVLPFVSSDEIVAETVYSISALLSLYKPIKKCVSSPHGVVYMAAKKHYFGVGGGSRRFLSMVEKYGELHLVRYLVSTTIKESGSFYYFGISIQRFIFEANKNLSSDQC